MYIYLYINNHVFQRGQEEGLDWTIKLLCKNSLSISPCWIVVPNMLYWTEKRDITHRNQTKHVKYVAYLLGKSTCFTLPFQSRHKKKHLNFTRQNSLYLGKQKHIFVPQQSNQTIPSQQQKYSFQLHSSPFFTKMF